MSYLPNCDDENLKFMWTECFNTFLDWYVDTAKAESIDNLKVLKIHCHLAFEELFREWLDNTDWEKAYKRINTGDIMMTEKPIEKSAEEMQQDCPIDPCSVDLWEFNGSVKPKFWFGEQVEFLSSSGTIVGVEWLENVIFNEQWRSLEEGQWSLEEEWWSLEKGWWYLLSIEGRDSFPRVHESELKAIM